MIRRHKGFTLIELVMVIGILAVVVGLSSDILVTLVRGYNKSQVNNNIQQGANFAVSKLTKELKSGKSVTSPALGVGASSLTFVDQSNTSITYQVSGNILSRCTGACASVVNLNYTGTGSFDAAYVTCPVGGCFNRISANPDTVNISLIFTQANAANPQFAATTNIKNTVIVKGSY